MKDQNQLKHTLGGEFILMAMVVFLPPASAHCAYKVLADLVASWCLCQVETELQRSDCEGVKCFSWAQRFGCT